MSRARVLADFSGGLLTPARPAFSGSHNAPKEEWS